MKGEEGVARKEWNARTTLSIASRKGGCERTEEKPSDQKGWEKGEKGASGEEGAMTKKGREEKCNEGRPPKKVEELSRRCCLLLISPSPNSLLSSSLLSSPPPFQLPPATPPRDPPLHYSWLCQRRLPLYFYGIILGKILCREKLDIEPRVHAVSRGETRMCILSGGCTVEWDDILGRERRGERKEAWENKKQTQIERDGTRWNLGENTNCTILIINNIWVASSFTKNGKTERYVKSMEKRPEVHPPRKVYNLFDITVKRILRDAMINIC